MGKDTDQISCYELYSTDKYKPTWDRIFSEPGDVYVGGGGEWLEYDKPNRSQKPDERAQNDELSFEDDLGDDYPRGV